MANRRGTEHAKNIMGALEDASRPLSAYDLLDRLRPTGVAAPLTVYRALDKLIASGRVHRIESLNAFVACRNGEHHHVHTDVETASMPARATGFAICDRCGSVEEFVDAGVFSHLDRAMDQRRFIPHATAIEVHGLCASCVAAAGRDVQAYGAEPLP